MLIDYARVSGSETLRFTVTVLVTLCVTAVMVGCGGEHEGRGGGDTPILCYAEELVMPAMSEIAEEFTAETGKKVVLDHDDGYALYKSIAETRVGDVFVCHDPYQAAIEKQKLQKKLWVLARIKPVITVQKGNPHSVTGLRDFARRDLRTFVPDYSMTLAGMVLYRAFQKAGLFSELDEKVREIGSDAATAGSVLQADVSFGWYAYVLQHDDRLASVALDVSAQPVPGVDAVTTATYGTIDLGDIKVTVSTLTCSKQPAAAARFAEYAAADERAETWRAHGFSPAGRRSQ